MLSTLYVSNIITGQDVDVAARFPELALNCTVAQYFSPIQAGGGVHGGGGGVPQTSMVVGVVG